MTSEEIAKIFSNLGYETDSHDGLGYTIKMSAEDAYVFSAVTGAKYLFYENGITMKGRCEVFIHRPVFCHNHLIYSPGLFSRDIDGYLTEGNSANALVRKYPQVFLSSKKIIIADVPAGVPSNIESKIRNALLNDRANPDEFVLYKNYQSNNVGESLLEYFASLYFIKNGYIVENQVPWFQQNHSYKGQILQGGIPDFSAFHSGISDLLFENKIIDSNNGIPIVLLPVIKLFRNDVFKAKATSTRTYGHKVLIGEAKTSSTSLKQAAAQLKKYRAVDVADALFTILPTKTSCDDFGALYIDEDHNIRYSEVNANITKDERSRTDGEWLDLYVKMLLLGNVYFDAVIDFITAFRRDNCLPLYEKYKAHHLLDAVQNTPNADFFDFIKEHIWHTQAI